MIVTLGPTSCPFAPWNPADGLNFEVFAFDCETTLIDDNQPALVPSYILGAACDGRRGVFVSRENLKPFLRAHKGATTTFFNAAFDLKVMDHFVSPDIDVYTAVEAGTIWDTMILHRLYTLATAGHPARSGAALDDCARKYLGIELPKDPEVRLTFGRYLGRPPFEIPQTHLNYLARDALATWHVKQVLDTRIAQIFANSAGVWGYTSAERLAECVERYGPLTHHIQLRASILVDALGRNGIGIDRGRRDEKVERLQADRAILLERLRRRGYLPGEPGNQKALQSILAEFYRNHPDIERHRTDSGEQWSTKEEHLNDLTVHDDFFRDLLLFRTVEKLLQTYATKMGRRRLHPKYSYLVSTGRTACGGGINLQNLPKERDEADPAATVRGCFVPDAGKVFVDADYCQVELLALGHAVQAQFGVPSELARLINAGEDVHRLLAAKVLNKAPNEITKDERNGVKAISFGRPGGMGPDCLRRVAKNTYGIDLSESAVQERVQAYHTLCPELDFYLCDEADTGLKLAEWLGLCPASFAAGTGKWYDQRHVDSGRPQGMLGGMLLKVLADPAPVTRRGEGRAYTPEEIDFFWRAAAPLAESLNPNLRCHILGRQASPELSRAVRDLFSRRSVFTATGRLRANATYSAARNCIFQGLAADGAILGMWRVWRAGYKIVAFVHDQLVVEIPANDSVPEHVRTVERLMITGMQEVLPGMAIKVESLITLSLNKKEVDPRYSVSSQPPSRPEPVAA